MITTETRTVGTIDLSETLIVTDPCYIPDSLYHGQLTEQLDVRPGRYEGTIEMSDEGNWGNRVSSLRVQRIGSTISYRQYAGRVAVDSGQMMFLSGDALNRWVDEQFSLMGDPITEEANKEYVGLLSYNGTCLATLTDQPAQRPQRPDHRNPLGVRRTGLSRCRSGAQLLARSWQGGVHIGDR